MGQVLHWWKKMGGLPNSDARYWARALLQFISGEHITLYVGHDDRVSRPEFLREDYTDTGDDFKLGDAPDDCRMYMVIAKTK